MMLPSTPLAGLRVLDASRVLAGPFCGQTLADLGAEVLKLERPSMPDETRTWGPPWHGDLSAYYLSCNRGKKAFTLDLGQAEGVTILHDLLGHCDVLIENFLPATARKLKLDAQTLHARWPKLILCSITGYGQTGPWADRPGYDFALQAQSGLMSITGPVEGPPSKVGVAVVDILAGLYAAIGILACVQARHASGHGYAIDVSMLDCAIAAQVNVAQAYLTSGKVPTRQGNAHLQIVPYQLFATADGHIVLAVGNDGQWQRFCAAANLPTLAADPRFTHNPSRVEHRLELIRQLEPVFRGFTSAEWEARLTAAEVPHSLVHDYAEVFAHPQAAARNLRISVKDTDGRPVDLIGPPLKVTGAAKAAPVMPPRVGQHTDEVLSRYLNLDANQIAELRQRGIV